MQGSVVCKSYDISREAFPNYQKSSIFLIILDTCTARMVFGKCVRNFAGPGGSKLEVGTFAFTVLSLLYLGMVVSLPFLNHQWFSAWVNTENAPLGFRNFRNSQFLRNGIKMLLDGKSVLKKL